MCVLVLFFFCCAPCLPSFQHTPTIFPCGAHLVLQLQEATQVEAEFSPRHFSIMRVMWRCRRSSKWWNGKQPRLHSRLSCSDQGSGTQYHTSPQRSWVFGLFGEAELLGMRESPSRGAWRNSLQTEGGCSKSRPDSVRRTAT